MISIFRQMVLFIITLSLTLFIFACSGTKTQLKQPDLRISKATLSKKIEDQSFTGIPRNQTNEFSVLDAEIFSCISLKDLSGKHKLKWDWIKPDGTLYCSTGNTVIDTEKGKYRKVTTAWHKIPIHGEVAAGFPGQWQVKISFDDDVVASNKFIVTDIEVDNFTQILQRPDPKKWAIIIGIENYANLPSVKYARGDAELFEKYFKEIIGVPEKNLILLIDNDATKGRIEGYLKSYLPSNLNKDATLYVYFSGHGTPSIKGSDAYLVPYDGDPKFIEHTGYKLETLYKDLDTLQIKQSIVFIDSCFSGVEARGKDMLIPGARPALIHVEEIKVTPKKVISLSASTGTQISQSYPEKEHGLFSYFILKGIRGAADTDKNNIVSIQELYEYTKQNVNIISRRMGLEQTPVILPSFDTIETINISKIDR